MNIQSQISRDHLGSITGVESWLYSSVSDLHPLHIDCIPNPDDLVYYHFDAFGRRPDNDEWGYNTEEEPELFADRGFTGHEHLTEFGLINMNGRLYDPLVGRFLSPDNYVQAPGYTQSYNRYAYCLNNPLRYTDPSGEFIEFLIAGAFYYLKGAYDNRDKTTGKWAWNPIDWFGKDQTGFVVGVSTNTDFTNVNYYGGLYSPDYSPVLAYNPDYGVGMSNAVNPGSNTFYYPSYNFGAARQTADKFIVEANAASQGGGKRELVATGEVTSIVLFAGGGVGIEAGTIFYKGEEYGIVSLAVGGGLDISGGWNFLRIYADLNYFNIYDLEGAGGQGNASIFIIGGSLEAPSSGGQITNKYRTKSWGWEIGPPVLWGGLSWTHTSTKIIPPGKNPTLYDLYISRPGGY